MTSPVNPICPDCGKSIPSDPALPHQCPSPYPILLGATSAIILVILFIIGLFA